MKRYTPAWARRASMPRALSCMVSVAISLTSWLLTAQTTAVSNRGQTAISNIGVGKTISGPFDFQEAFSFTTGASASLFSVTLSMATATSGALTGFGVSLYSGISAAGPTGAIVNFSGSSSPVTAADYTYTPVSPTALSAATTYWLVASAPTVAAGDNSFGVISTNSLAEDAAALSGWSIGNLRWVTNNGGASWFSTGTQLGVFSVEVAAVPEPSLMATLLGSVAVVAAIRVRRKDRSSNVSRGGPA